MGQGVTNLLCECTKNLGLTQDMKPHMEGKGITWCKTGLGEGILGSTKKKWIVALKCCNHRMLGVLNVDCIQLNLPLYMGNPLTGMSLKTAKENMPNL